MSTTTILILAVLINAVICAGLAAYIADKKGHSGGSWGFCGFVFGLLGLIAAAGLPDRTFSRASPPTSRRPCPTCAENIGLAAKRCPHCGQSFPPEEILASILPLLEQEEQSAVWARNVLASARLPGTADALVPLLTKHTGAALHAAHALGEMRDRSAVQTLIALLQQPGLERADTYSTQYRAAEAAAEALGIIGDPSAVKPLVGLLHEEGRVFGLASQAILGIGQAALQPLSEMGAENHKALTKTLQSLEKRIRARDEASQAT